MKLLLLSLMIFLLNHSHAQEAVVKNNPHTIPFKILKGHKHKVQRAQFSQDGKYLIAGRPEADIFVWRMKSILKGPK